MDHRARRWTTSALVALYTRLGDPASPNSARAMQAMLQMKQIDLAKIRQACDGAA